MIWLTWRQFRTQAWVAAAALAVIAVALALTGLNLAHLYDATGAASCQAFGQVLHVVFNAAQHRKIVLVHVKHVHGE